MKYRAEIDGLRALAVSAVVLFHAGFTSIPGGYLGVDIFFVISGFLISGIILGQERLSFSFLADFYARRVSRILPALYFVLLATLVVLYFVALPDALVSYAASMRSVVLFYSNLYFYKTSDYFSEGAEKLPLLHTWSLSVEEQFYFLFPLFLIVVLRYISSYLVFLLVGLTLFSLIGYVYVDSIDPSLAFFATPLRGWELLWGCSLAACVRYEALLRLKPVAAEAICLICVFVMVLSFFLVEPTYAVFWSVPAVISCGLFIVFSGRSVLVKALFSNRFVVAVGLISYSLYLWHQPVFSLYRIAWGADIDYAQRWLLICVAIILAGVTYKLIENPFRRRFLVGRRAAAIYFMGGISFLLLLSMLVLKTGGFEGRFDHDISKFFRSNIDSSFSHVSDCHANSEFQFTGSGCGVGLKKKTPVAVLYGDSHAGAIAFSLGKRLEKYGMGLRMFTDNGCRPLLHVYKSYGKGVDVTCQEFNSRFLEYIRRGDKIPLLIISFRWPADFPEGRRGEGGFFEGYAKIPVGLDSASGDSVRHVLTEDMRNTLTLAMSKAEKVILVYPIPRAAFNVPDALANNAIQGKGNFYLDFAKYRSESKYAESLLDSLIAPGKIFRVYPARVFCDEKLGGCRVADSEGSYYIDDNHLSVLGGDRLFGGEDFTRSLR